MVYHSETLLNSQQYQQTRLQREHKTLNGFISRLLTQIECSYTETVKVFTVPDSHRTESSLRVIKLSSLKPRFLWRRGLYEAFYGFFPLNLQAHEMLFLHMIVTILFPLPPVGLLLESDGH